MAKASYNELLGRLAKARVAKRKKHARLAAKGKKPVVRVSMKRFQAMQAKADAAPSQKTARKVGRLEF